MKKTIPQDEILKALQDGKTIQLLSYTMSSETENNLDALINLLLQNYDKSELKFLLFTCIKELAINGIKANLKRIFFEQNGLNLNSPNEYIIGLKKYKDRYNEKIVFESSPETKNNGISVKIKFFHQPNGIRIEVINNSPLSFFEEARIREKLLIISNYNNMMDFYEDNQDTQNNAGMGLALIVTLLKNSGVNSNLFRIFNREDETVARIEFPFSADYEPIRRLL